MATVFFDFDGTLHDTMRIYGPAFRLGYEGLVKSGWAQPREFTDEWISRWLGWTIEDMWHSFMPQLPDEVWREASHQIGVEMERLMNEGCSCLYEGIPQALDDLKESGYDLAILSNSSLKYMGVHRRFFDLDKWFSAYHLAGDYPGKEKWEILQLSLPGHEGPFALVGDRFHDIEAGVKLGIPSLGCKWGCGDPTELEEASLRLDSPSQIPAALESLLA